MTSNLPGVDGDWLAAELTSQLDIGVLLDAGQAQGPPRRPDLVDVAHDPGHPIDGLVVLGQLRRARRYQPKRDSKTTYVAQRNLLLHQTIYFNRPAGN